MKAYEDYWLEPWFPEEAQDKKTCEAYEWVWSDTLNRCYGTESEKEAAENGYSPESVSPEEERRDTDPNSPNNYDLPGNLYDYFYDFYDSYGNYSTYPIASRRIKI